MSDSTELAVPIGEDLIKRIDHWYSVGTIRIHRDRKIHFEDH